MTIEYERHVAKITRTFLGVEDHGIFTVNLWLDYGGSQQGAGGYALDSYDERIKRRVGTADGMEFVIRVLRACGVQSWEELKGRTIYALKDVADGNLGLVRGVEPLPTEPGERFVFADAFAVEAVSA